MCMFSGLFFPYQTLWVSCQMMLPFDVLALCIPGKNLFISVSQKAFYLLPSLQTTSNKCIRESIYNTVIQRRKLNLWLCAPLLKHGTQKEIRIDFFKCLCQERYGSCIQRFGSSFSLALLIFIN